MTFLCSFCPTPDLSLSPPIADSLPPETVASTHRGEGDSRPLPGPGRRPGLGVFLLWGGAAIAFAQVSAVGVG